MLVGMPFPLWGLTHILGGRFLGPSSLYRKVGNCSWICPIPGLRPPERGCYVGHGLHWITGGPGISLGMFPLLRSEGSVLGYSIISHHNPFGSDPSASNHKATGTLTALGYSLLECGSIGSSAPSRGGGNQGLPHSLFPALDPAAFPMFGAAASFLRGGKTILMLENYWQLLELG